jgi:hypothetical protein
MKSIEELLGRQLPAEAQGSVPTLNDLPPEMLAEARRLAKEARVLAVRYLTYHVARCDMDDAAEFTDDVLRGGGDAAKWRVRDLLCFAKLDRSSLLAFSVEAFSARLQEVKGERWWRAVPTRAAWDYTGVAGAPAVLVRSAPYWWKSPAGAVAARGVRAMEQVSDNQLSVAVRRWLASRMAWEAKAYLAQGTPSVEGLVVALGGQEQPSADARVAAQALVREASLTAEAASAAPGFAGPDSWYSIGREDA